MDIFEKLLPMFTALLGFLVGLYTSRKQREHESAKFYIESKMKLSDHRINWINNLRDTMAEFQAIGVVPGIDHSKDKRFYETGTKIELLMNPNDPDYPALQKALYRFLGASTVMEKFSANPEYIEICQRILKREWERTKQEAYDFTGYGLK